MPRWTDEQITTLVQKGNVDLFRELVERYESKMSRYARRFLFDADEVKDLLQEVFVKVYVNIQSFDSSRRFSPWLYRIAHNEFVNALKKKKKYRETVSLFYADMLFPYLIAEGNAAEDMSRREIKEILEESLDKLNPKYREPLVLYYLEDMDYKEIANVLRIPVSTVGVQLQRGKTLLRKLVKEKTGP